MILYERTRWYGLGYLIGPVAFHNISGSLIPRCIPATLFAGMLAMLFTTSYLPSSLIEPFREADLPVYAVQVYGLVFGYLAVGRLNISYSRYWEGVGHIKEMHSKWTDACTQILNFDQVHTKELQLHAEPFCKHVVRLFCQLSAAATLRLHVDERNALRFLAYDPLADANERAQARIKALQHDPRVQEAVILIQSTARGRMVRSQGDVGRRERTQVGGRWTRRKSQAGSSGRAWLSSSGQRSSAILKPKGQVSPGCPGQSKNGDAGAINAKKSAASQFATCPKRMHFGHVLSSGSLTAILGQLRQKTAGGGGDSQSSKQPKSIAGGQHAQASTATPGCGRAAKSRSTNQSMETRRSTNQVSMGRRKSLRDRSSMMESSCTRWGFKSKAHERKAVLEEGIGNDEMAFVRGAPCPVTAISQRIVRSVITRQHAGGLSAPPPIVSRVFQEISNGMRAYNAATKMKEIPVPFAYVQFNALLLIVFFFTAPIGMAALGFSVSEDHESIAMKFMVVVMSMFTVASFTSLWLIANELEDPFGSEPNDMPMLQFHNEFCDTLHYSLHHSWMKADNWIVKAGPWKETHPEALRQAYEMEATDTSPLSVIYAPPIISRSGSQLPHLEAELPLQYDTAPQFVALAQGGPVKFTAAMKRARKRAKSPRLPIGSSWS